MDNLPDLHISNNKRGLMKVLTEQGLNLLRLINTAKELGNVSEVCRQAGLSRTQFYEFKRRYDKYGLVGLNDKPPIYV